MAGIKIFSPWQGLKSSPPFAGIKIPANNIDRAYGTL
jgi:hypothetical protein